MRILRRLAVVSISCAAAGLAVGGTAAPADAEDGFTYWGYYELTDGEWQFAQKGATEVTPDDGAVEGWRHATNTTQITRAPRADLTFDQICADTDSAAGEKRVGVVLDYGTTEDAPDGARPPDPEALCAVVPADANGQQVLDEVAQVRVEDGLTCGINGYPATGCSPTVKNATPPTAEDTVEFAVPAGDEGEPAADDAADDVAGDAAGGEGSGDEGVSWGFVGAGALVLALTAVTAFVARRRG